MADNDTVDHSVIIQIGLQSVGTEDRIQPADHLGHAPIIVPANSPDEFGSTQRRIGKAGDTFAANVHLARVVRVVDPGALSSQLIKHGDDLKPKQGKDS